jgi:hypothetical protein
MTAGHLRVNDLEVSALIPTDDKGPAGDNW